MKTELNYEGVDLSIEFDYQPFERAERGPEAQYPGCEESAEIIEIKVGEIDITDLMYHHFDKLEEIILEELHTDYRF